MEAEDSVIIYLFVKFYERKNLPCKSKMAPIYVFATSMLCRRLLPLDVVCLYILDFLHFIPFVDIFILMPRC